MSTLRQRFLERAGLTEPVGLATLVEAVRSIPYGRPSVRTPSGVVEEWRGTCSTKHLLLRELADGPVELVHRVYRLSPADARGRFGDRAAAAVPGDGLVDVHRYARALVDGRWVTIDVTFPGGEPWDGRTDMPLACGEGEDLPAGADPDADKRALEAAHCDPAAREPFIAALADARA